MHEFDSDVFSGNQYPGLLFVMYVQYLNGFFCFLIVLLVMGNVPFQYLIFHGLYLGPCPPDTPWFGNAFPPAVVATAQYDRRAYTCLDHR